MRHADKLALNDKNPEKDTSQALLFPEVGAVEEEISRFNKLRISYLRSVAMLAWLILLAIVDSRIKFAAPFHDEISIVIILVAALTLAFTYLNFLIPLGTFVTRKNELEGKLKKYAEMHRAFMENTVDGFIVLDENGILRYANPAAREFFGRAEHKLMNQPLDYQSGKGNADEITIIKEDGSVSVGETKMSPSTWEGKPATIVTIRDITSKKEAQMRLAESERRFRDLFESVNILAVQLDVNGDITFANNFFLNRTGYRLEHLAGKNLFDVFIPDEKSALLMRRAHERLLNGSAESNHWTNEIAAASGERLLISWNNTVLRDEHRVITGSASLGIDITDLWKAEKALRWESAVNESLAGLAHGIISRRSPKIEEMFGMFLSDARKLTASPFGFVGYIDNKTGYFVAPTLTQDIWEECQVPNKSPVFKEFSGLWGWALRNGQPIYTNDAQNDPRSSGAPSGHIPIKRFLAAPAMVGGKAVGLIALANAENDYGDKDLDAVKRLADLCAIAIHSYWIEESLHVSSDFLANLINTIPSPVYYVDSGDTVQDCNVAMERFLGRSKSAIVGKSWKDFFKEEDALALKSMSEYVLLTMQAATAELSVTRASSASARNIIVTAAPSRDSGGRTSGLVGVFTDITEKLKSEEMLRENDERFRAIAENASLGIVQVDVGGIIVYWNREAENILGFSSEEALGRKFFDLCAPGDPERKFSDIMENRLSQGKDIPVTPGIEEVLTRKDGTLATIELAVAQYMTRGGWNIVGIFSDVTERKEKELKLAELYSAVEQSPAAVLITDREGRVEYMNRKAMSLLGVSESVAGKSIFENGYFCKNGEAESIMDAMNSGSELAMELNGTLFNKGEDEWFDFSLTPIVDDNHNPAASLIIVEEITERRKWSQSLEQTNRKLREAVEQLNATQRHLIRSEKLASLGALSAGVAHEIKNPLNIISMNAQLMKMQVTDGGEMSKTIDTILGQVIRAAKITDNLRDFARERRPEIIDINLIDFIDKTIALVEYEMNVENIVIERVFPENPVTIPGDPDQLAQVFLNIIGNARDAINSKQAGADYSELMKISWKGWLRVKVSEDGGNAVISFYDNGVGIGEAALNRIFDPFFTTKSEGKGTGLGLAIAYGIIQSHNGDIEARSKEGEWSELTITLPKACKYGN